MHTIFDRAVAPRATAGVSLALMTIYLIACVMLVPLAIGLLAEAPSSPDAITDVER